MYSEPCVRLGIRISPKMSAKPDDSRNNSPPNVMLLTVSDTQKFIYAFALRASCPEQFLSVIPGRREAADPESILRSVGDYGFRVRSLRSRPGMTVTGGERPSPVSRLQRRIVARIDRLREELLLIIGPELTDVVIGLDRLVDELAVLFVHPA